jgi:DNA-binding NarL/FixJ family response regulator
MPPLPLPMLIDLFFYVAILLLLQQLNRKIAQKNKVIDGETLNRFKALLDESQAAGDRFLGVLEQEVRTLQKLFQQVEEKETVMVSLLEAAETFRAKREGGAPAPPPARTDRNAEILEMVGEGLTREMISRRTGFTDGEIELVIELDRAGRNHR